MRIFPVNYSIYSKPYDFHKKQTCENKVMQNYTSNIYFGRDLVTNYNRETVINYLNSNPTPIAQGTDGIIFKQGNKAIKVAKTKETSFEAEANILKHLPKSLKTSQSYIDYFKHNGKDVLVSSFVEGKHKKALSPNDLDKLFIVILEHDKSNIIHGDLNLGNIMFTPNGEISLIDYGASTIPESTQVELYPNFVENTNALKLENTGINDSLKTWAKTGEARKNFIEYLSKKADFYSKHAQLTKSEEAKDYEENLSIVLKSPNNDVIETELKRITTLDLLESADTATNYDNNPHEAIKLWNKTVDNAKEYESYTNEKINSSITDEERTYFKYQNEIAKCFHQTLTDWRNGTINWLYQIKEENYIPQSEAEQRIKQNWK